jgi:hypothetical protein
MLRRRCRPSGRAVFTVLVAGLTLSLSAGRAEAADVTISVPTTFAAADASDGSPDGVFTVTGNLTITGGGSITCNDSGASNNSACPMAIRVTGNMVMDSGSLIQAENQTAGGSGGNIAIEVAGDFTMNGTASISSAKKSGSGDTGLAGNITIRVGNYPEAPPSGLFQMNSGSSIVADGTGSAGDIAITAGKTMMVDGLVSSAGGLTGTGAVQGRGGGMIALDAGCTLEVSATGKVTSSGRDPGADLVHLSGCSVTVLGRVESISPGDGHALPNNPANHCNDDPNAHPVGSGDVANGYTACVEIWGKDITVSGSGEVSADGVRSPMRAWIDLYSANTISILGGSSAYSVHANACPAGSTGSPPCSNSFGGLVTVIAVTSVTTSGNAVQANATAIGGNGGDETIAAQNVDLGASSVQAIGPNGSNTRGGNIRVRAFTGDITGASGELNAAGGNGNGTVQLAACASPISFSGTTTPTPPATFPGVCGGLPQARGGVRFLPQIWEKCSSIAVETRRFSGRAAGRGVVLSWQTASEAQIVGYNVYRVGSGGVATRVNARLIPARFAGRAHDATYRLVHGKRGSSYKLQIVRPDGSRTDAGTTRLRA